MVEKIRHSQVFLVLDEYQRRSSLIICFIIHGPHSSILGNYEFVKHCVIHNYYTEKSPFIIACRKSEGRIRYLCMYVYLGEFGSKAIVMLSFATSLVLWECIHRRKTWTHTKYTTKFGQSKWALLFVYYYDHKKISINEAFSFMYLFN